MANSQAGTYIEPTPDGPYKVQGLEMLSNSKGEQLATKPTVFLCRCGRSGNKPFCDGTHAKVGFESRKLTDGALNQRESFSAGSLTVHDNRGICAHIGKCTDGLPGVFRVDQEPFVDPTGGSPDTVAAQVRQCPSGALSHSLDGVEHRDQDGAPAILVSKDGPYFVTGTIGLSVDDWGDGASQEHYALCRCGGSKNKPFCDGTHWQGFKDDKN